MSKANFVRIIGDCHGAIGSKDRKGPSYLNLLEGVPYSIQIGDLGFDYRLLEKYGGEGGVCDAAHHKFLAGNHDNFTWLSKYPLKNDLGRFGARNLGGLDFFFVAGAYSVDKAYRHPGLDWWPEEELDVVERQACKEAYIAAKPKLMITHDAPREICFRMIESGLGIKSIGFNHNTTTDLLQELYEIHQPDLWIYGHWHSDFRRKEGNTQFVCLDILEYMDIEI